MARFRKKPIEIEAVQWTGQNIAELDQWWAAHGNYCAGSPDRDLPDKLAIRTLEGTMFADPGDWIIRGVAGEYYPCKPDIFEATYDGPLPDAETVLAEAITTCGECGGAGTIEGFTMAGGDLGIETTRCPACNPDAQESTEAGG